MVCFDLCDFGKNYINHEINGVWTYRLCTYGLWTTPIDQCIYGLCTMDDARMDYAPKD